MEKGSPIPSNKLKRGPPKHALKPALGDPLLAIDVSAMRSPMELPQANTVNPRKFVFEIDISRPGIGQFSFIQNSDWLKAFPKHYT